MTSEDGTGRWLGAAVSVMAIGFVAVLLAGAIGSLAPDTVVAVADPFVCDGELVRSSVAGPSGQGGEAISNDVRCVADDGTARGMTARVYLTAGLVYAAALGAMVAAAMALRRVRRRRPVTERARIDRSARIGVRLVTAVIAAPLLVTGLTADPLSVGRLWSAAFVVWLGAILVVDHPVDDQVDEVDAAALRRRALRRLPGSAFFRIAPGAMTLWYARADLVDGDPTRGPLTVVGAVLTVLGVLGMVSIIRTLLDPERQLRRRRRLPADAEAHRERRDRLRRHRGAGFRSR
ncbi:MAG: hypothetical protein AAF962_19825 [Actinomycetota bacterium]